jgi:hypothetical protein
VANTHTKTEQEFIVRKLAAREPPKEIVANFAAIFPNTKCDETDVRRLMPGNVVLPPELHALYAEERERVKNDPESAPYSDQQERLRIYSQDVNFHRSNNQRAEARGVLRLIAEELGVIGGKLGKGAPADSEPVASITRTIVYPSHTEEKPSEQQQQESTDA